MSQTVAEVLIRKDVTSWLFRNNGRAANQSDEEVARLGRKICDAVPAEPGQYEVVVRLKRERGIG